jgi:hypothetical protein
MKFRITTKEGQVILETDDEQATHAMLDGIFEREDFTEAGEWSLWEEGNDEPIRTVSVEVE